MQPYDIARMRSCIKLKELYVHRQNCYKRMKEKQEDFTERDEKCKKMESITVNSVLNISQNDIDNK